MNRRLMLIVSLVYIVVVFGLLGRCPAQVSVEQAQADMLKKLAATRAASTQPTIDELQHEIYELKTQEKYLEKQLADSKADNAKLRQQISALALSKDKATTKDDKAPHIGMAEKDLIDYFVAQNKLNPLLVLKVGSESADGKTYQSWLYPDGDPENPINYKRIIQTFIIADGKVADIINNNNSR